MAIARNDTITYGDLKNDFFNWLKTSCVNIGSGSTVPDYFKSTYKKDFPLEYIAKQDGEVKETVTARITLDRSSVLQNVTVQQISADFDDFMRARDIDTKTDKLITTRGIINFWNNVASFCTVNIMFVTGQEINVATSANKKSTFRYYKTSPRNGQTIDISKYPSVPVVDEEETITASDVVQMLGNLEEVINKTAKTHQLLYKIEMVCSSCSSCSSSSSSSSSSSAFIVYMKL